MKPGTRVRVCAKWSSLRGLVGTVVAEQPSVMVALDGDPKPLRIEPVSLEVVEPVEAHVTND